MLSDLAFDLAKDGVNVHIVTGRQLYDDPSTLLPSTESINDVKIHRIWATRFGRGRLLGRALDYLTFYLSAGMRLLRLVDREDLVVAKTDPPLISAVVAIATRMRSARFINWVQDLFPEVAAALNIKGVNGFAFRLIRRIRNMSLRTAVMNVALGELMAECLANQKVGRDRIKIIPNWADEQELVPVPAHGNPLRIEWGLRDRFVVGYSGNLGRAHEFDTMLAAAESLREDSAIIFLIVGGGAQLDRLKTNVAKRGLRNFVFRPYQPRDKLAQSLSAADVHLISLKPQLEGMIVPSKFYGIAAVGLPTIFIGQKSGEIASILLREDCGFAVEIGDFANLCTNLQLLRNDESLRSRLGANARRAFETQFSRRKATAAWRELLKNC